MGLGDSWGEEIYVNLKLFGGIYRQFFFHEIYVNFKPFQRNLLLSAAVSQHTLVCHRNWNRSEMKSYHKFSLDWFYLKFM